MEAQVRGCSRGEDNILSVTVVVPTTGASPKRYAEATFLTGGGNVLTKTCAVVANFPENVRMTVMIDGNLFPAYCRAIEEGYIAEIPFDAPEDTAHDPWEADDPNYCSRWDVIV